MNTDIDILLAKYFGGEVSAKDLNRLDDWIAQSEANQEYFDQMTLLYEKSAQFTPSRKPDTGSAWDKLEQHMQQQKEKEAENEIKPSEVKIKPIKRSIRFYLQIAAVFIAFIAVSMFFYLQDDKIQSIEIAATKAMLNHTMPDNSKILLGENSVLAYNSDYGEENRNMSLTGKAVIDVGTKGKGKMIIKAGETFIEDIGTVFTVDAYPSDLHVTVEVESGKVFFYTDTNNGIEIVAGETGRFYKSTKLFEKLLYVNEPETINELIVFNATPLYEAVNVLSQKFGVQIKVVDNNLNNKQITVSFDPDDNIEDVLQIIAETLLLKIGYENNTYILSHP